MSDSVLFAGSTRYSYWPSILVMSSKHNASGPSFIGSYRHAASSFISAAAPNMI